MSVNQLERIATLVERLRPLAGKVRGMRIEADEWNELVEVLQGSLEIDRTQETEAGGLLASEFARRLHEHLGQVTLTWLDVDLQARLAEAGGSVSVRSTLSEVTKRLENLASEKMTIDYKTIARNPVVRISGAIMFLLSVYAVYNGTATLTEATPLFLLCLWIAGGSPTKTKTKKSDDEHNHKSN